MTATSPRVVETHTVVLVLGGDRGQDRRAAVHGLPADGAEWRHGAAEHPVDHDA